MRERFAISESALPEALARLKTIPGLTEGLIVSTCNRTEFYVTGEFRYSSAPAFFESFYGDFVSNRSFERAQALATITGGRAIHFEDWEREFSDLDILVSSTAAPHAIITVDKLAPFLRAHRHRPLFMIDLAMPRDIDPAVRKLDGVYLYDLDSLQSMAERSLAVRKQESEKCRQLIEHNVRDFQLWIEPKRRNWNKPQIPQIATDLNWLEASEGL